MLNPTPELKNEMTFNPNPGCIGMKKAHKQVKGRCKVIITRKNIKKLFNP